MICLRGTLWAGFVDLVCILFFVSTFLAFSEVDIKCPEPICTCKKGNATCSGNLSYIPPLPSETKILTFENNYLPVISRETFVNITNLKLTSIDLSECAIENVTFNAFHDFKSTLTALDLSRNMGINKTQLFSSLRTLGIKYLILNQINMDDKDYSMYFEGMVNSSIQAIRLQRNRFRNINDQVFQSFRYLKLLDLSNNGIQTIELLGLASLVHLYLGFNKLSEIPEVCFGNGTSKFQSIRRLYLGSNDIANLNKTSFSCLTYLTKLHLNDNNIVVLDDNIFSHLRQLNELNLNSLKLNKISSFAFNNSHLSDLSLSHCGIKFKDENFDYANLFRWCPNLVNLKLDWNNFSKLNATFVISMLSPLSKLQYLNLENNKFKNIPADFFKPLVSLSHLVFTKNFISEWPITLFHNVRQLRKLIISSNKISVIREQYLPPSFVRNLNTLDISDNPFDCSCENLWFRKWIENITHQKPKLLSNYPSHYLCASPLHLQRTLLKSYNPTEEDCYPWSRVLMDILIISSASIVVFTVVAVVYIQRWNIRYLLHVITMRKKKYTFIKDAEFQYDIYVAYSDKDASWVRNELYRELELERGLKLYIRDKSEDPGIAKCDSIINNMYDSRKVLLVLSSNFMSCPWCLYQLQVAQARAVHNGPNWIIPVILGDLQVRHVTRSIRSLLTQENVLTWSDEENGKLLFWTTILGSMETSKILNDVIGDNSLQ